MIHYTSEAHEVTNTIWTYSEKQILFAGCRFDRLTQPAYHKSSWVVTEWCLTLPLWYPLALFAIPPTLWIWRERIRRRRTKLGHCRKCGYDLTGNVSGV